MISGSRQVQITTDSGLEDNTAPSSDDILTEDADWFNSVTASCWWPEIECSQAGSDDIHKGSPGHLTSGDESLASPQDSGVPYEFSDPIDQYCRLIYISFTSYQT